MRFTVSVAQGCSEQLAWAQGAEILVATQEPYPAPGLRACREVSTSWGIDPHRLKGFIRLTQEFARLLEASFVGSRF